MCCSKISSEIQRKQYYERRTILWDRKNIVFIINLTVLFYFCLVHFPFLKNNCGKICITKFSNLTIFKCTVKGY